MRYYLLLAAVFLCCQLLIAQIADTTRHVVKSVSLKEVVVTGTGTEHYIKDAPVQTEVISGRTLKEYAGRDIEDVLGGLSSSITFNRVTWE